MSRFIRKTLTIGLVCALSLFVLTVTAQAEPITGTGCVDTVAHGDQAIVRQEAGNAAIADALRRTHVSDPRTGADLTIVVPRERVPRLLKSGWLGQVEILGEQQTDQHLCFTVQFILDAEPKAELARLYGQSSVESSPQLRSALSGSDQRGLWPILRPTLSSVWSGLSSTWSGFDPVTDPSKTQTFFALFGGLNFSSALHNVRGGNIDEGIPSGVTYSNLNLHSSPVIGVKAGHYFGEIVGVEAEVFTATPYLKQQTFTEHVPEQFCLPSCTQTGSTPGAHDRISTLAVNWVMRYPGKAIQPYVGAGLGVFWLWGNGPNTSEDSQVRPGWNLEAGIRAFVTERIALFGEYKFNYAGSLLGYNNSTTFGTGFSIGNGAKADYLAHLFVFGVGYHF